MRSKARCDNLGYGLNYEVKLISPSKLRRVRQNQCKQADPCPNPSTIPPPTIPPSLHSLRVGALEEDTQSEDPLLSVHVAVVVGVESLEHAVEQDVVGHVEGVVQKFSADKVRSNIYP